MPAGNLDWGGGGGGIPFLQETLIGGGGNPIPAGNLDWGGGGGGAGSHSCRKP